MRCLNTLIAACMVALSVLQGQAQVVVYTGEKIIPDTIGQMQLLVQYQTCILADTLKKNEKIEETTMLEVGKNLSKFYSYTKYICDSVITADYTNKASQETINGHLRQYGRSVLSECTVKGYPADKVTTFAEIAGFTKLRCEEPEERPQWILLTDTATLLSYQCQKAECRFKGRTWSVWFTHEIPVSEGPWKLYGLPGLILKAEDGQGHYSFVCTGIQQCRTSKPILVFGKKYELVSRKSYNKVHERYYADPVGFITGSVPNVTITVKDNNGNTMKGGPKNIGYNPIELSDDK